MDIDFLKTRVEHCNCKSKEINKKPTKERPYSHLMMIREKTESQRIKRIQ